MKLSSSPSRIAGVTLGECTLNMMGTGPLIKAKFALLNKDSSISGFIERSMDWSAEAQAALQAFSEVLEQDALRVLFEEQAQPAETSKSDPENQPDQF